MTLFTSVQPLLREKLSDIQHTVSRRNRTLAMTVAAATGHRYSVAASPLDHHGAVYNAAIARPLGT